MIKKIKQPPLRYGFIQSPTEYHDEETIDFVESDDNGKSTGTICEIPREYFKDLTGISPKEILKTKVSWIKDAWMLMPSRECPANFRIQGRDVFTAGYYIFPIDGGSCHGIDDVGFMCCSKFYRWFNFHVEEETEIVGFEVKLEKKKK